MRKINGNPKETIMNSKRLILVLLALFLAIGLVACGKEKEKEESKVLEGELSPNVQTTLTLYHKGDQLTGMTQVHHIEYKYTQFLDADDAKAKVEPTIANVGKIEGYSEKVEYKDKFMVSTVKIDFTKMKTEDMKKIPGLVLDGDTEKGLSYEKTLESYKSQGLKEK